MTIFKIFKKEDIEEGVINVDSNDATLEDETDASQNELEAVNN